MIRLNPLVLLQLPDELLLQIVSHLRPEHIIPLHRVCRRLRNLTRSDPTLWRTLCAYREALESESRPEDYTAACDVTALWPSPTETRVDWYSEYRFRYAPLSTRWVSAPGDEVKGLARVVGADKLVAPLADGSVCIWSAREVPRPCYSKPGVLFGERKSGNWEVRRKAREAEIGDGVVVDEVLGRVWVAGEEGLVELDLNTLQRISTTLFPFSISTLSSSAHPHPLTVGTTLTLHLHDHRLSTPALTTPLPENYTVHAPLFQPGPLSILHHPNSQIYVAGRFPSVLTYDRRLWPRLAGTIHSGGRLCTLAPSLDARGIIAGGEYNGRGTLEHYSLATTPASKEINRQTAARSKLLSVATHGARVVVGDGDGVLSWFERDCRALVRREVIHMPPPSSSEGGMWSTSGIAAGEAIRKVLVLNSSPEDCTGKGEELAVWCGDRVGLIRAGETGPEEDDTRAVVETEEAMRERVMRERMRAALERSADEVRFLGRLTGL